MSIDEDTIYHIENNIRENYRPLEAINEFKVYFLLQDNLIVYVGKSTNNVNGRVLSHRVDKEFDGYSFIVSRDEEEMSTLETLFILRYKPKYNKSIPASNEYMKLKDIQKHLNISHWAVKKLVRERCLLPVYMDLYGIIDFYAIEVKQTS
jgi:hypothetical protein